MATTYTNLNYHIVFSTKDRRPLITPPLRARLYPYITSIITGERGIVAAIGGTCDHIHLLVRWRPDVSISNLLKTVKSMSSGWVHRQDGLSPGFGWQEAYAAFTVSESQCARVAAYVECQENHHAGRDFKHELLALLASHGIGYDERYIWT